ncbi:MAG: tyrosine-type recombinase/integrase [Deltaproteobacteria bacterium]|jgi:integrase|nr:tyrosine-type recombinase/integrase [Deltaproteobacteria bacterium]
MLTFKQIDNAQPRTGAYKLYDGGGLGLYLEVKPSGSKLWRIQYTFQGRRLLKAMGAFPAVGLQDVRLEAAAFKKSLAESAELPTKKAKEPEKLLRDIAVEWADKFLSGRADKTRQKTLSLLDRKILPYLGNFRLKDVTPQTVLGDVLRPIEAQGTIETLNRVKTVISQIFRYSVANGLMERDFTLDLRGAFPPLIVKHRAAFTDPAEFGGFLKAIDSFHGSPVVSYALKILPYVFTRPGELRNAVWEEVSLDESLWRIPAARMKMRIAHVVPLASQVKALLSDLKELTGWGRLLFPGARTRTRPISDVAMTAAMRRMGFTKEEICPHGFRTTASTLLHEKGYPSEWIETQLAHRDANAVRAAYNRAEHLAERTKMMQEWADYLDSLRAS